MRWNRFLENIQSDIKLFIFILAMLCIYRMSFMYIMSGYMGDDVITSDVLLANWAGFRLSLKTAGVVMLFSVVFSTLPNLIINRISQSVLDKIKLTVGTLASFIFAVLFQARFPYYQEYGSTYGMHLLQGMDDDIYAILVMSIQEYGLVWRLTIALALTYVSFAILKRVLITVPLAWDISRVSFMKRIGIYFITLIACVVTFIFIRFGASMNYEHSINWENAGVTKDAFLNECILDDGQALYRVRAMHEKRKTGIVPGVYKDRIRELALSISDDKTIQSDRISDYIRRRANGEVISKPKHIFIILGESWAQWPMLEKYENLHITDGIKSLMSEENCFSTPYFMSTGDFTSAAITGMITGLSDVSISINYQPVSYQEVYSTSIAPNFHGLGYKVDFWYGGIPSWDNINKLAIAQGFDHFYGKPDFNGPDQSIWGTKDEYLFNAIEEHLAVEPPTVHVIMTTTNHPPYNLNLPEEGFDLEQAKGETAKLQNVENSEELAEELGHHWYMDKIVTQFIRNVIAKYPESIFVVTGDHATRTNPSRKPNLFEYQSVPFVLYGYGITKDILPQNVVGGHNSIMPTLIELIAPKGYEYYSLAESMTRHTQVTFNRTSWMTANMMAQIDGAEEYLFNEGTDRTVESEKAEKVWSAIKTLSWWMIMNGDKIQGGENK